ncbi:MAG: flagellar motor protein MotB [Thiohalomonadales bacterium]
MDLYHRNRLTSFSLKAIGLTVLVGLTLGGCVSQGSYDEVVAENSQLKKKALSMKGNLKHAQNQTADSTQALAAKSEVLEATEAQSAAEKEFYAGLVGELAGELQSNKVTIQQMKSGVNVNMTADILFASGSAKVSNEGELLLLKLGKKLNDVPYQTVVAGFTDNAKIGESLAKTFPTNWDLAATRATRVLKILEDSGIQKERLLAVSFGQNQPIASNDTVEGRKQNRRIEIRLRPVIK